MLDVETQNIRLKFAGNFGHYACIENALYLSGVVFHQGHKLSIESLYTLLKESLGNDDSLNNLLSNFSGFFSFVYVSDNTVFVVVDKLRSRPLFYSQNSEGHVTVSDDYSTLIKNEESTGIAKKFEYEMSRTGYVTGRDTLVENFKQVQAGEYVAITNNRIVCHTYFYFLPNNNVANEAENDLFQMLDQAMLESFSELDQLAKDKPIILPLSGGYDSRILAVFLKTLGFTDVTCFTFGRRSSKEVVISKQVAKNLGFAWHCVEYNKALWKKVHQSSHFEKYLRFICSYVSVANVQVYPAIRSLIEQGVVKPNAIVLPGHTGDFTSGGHIPKSLVGKAASDNIQSIVEQIKLRHCKVKSPLMDEKYLHNKLCEQVQRIIDWQGGECSAASAFEAWECRERQAKFIVNSNRYYDYHCLDWWMPLWSNAFINVWYDISVNERINSSLWQRYVEFKYAEVVGELNSCALGNVVNQYHPKVYRLRSIFDYFTDENGLYALVPFYRWVLRKLKYPYSKGTVFSYISHRIIKVLKQDVKKRE